MSTDPTDELLAAIREGLTNPDTPPEHRSILEAQLGMMADALAERKLTDALESIQSITATRAEKITLLLEWLEENEPEAFWEAITPWR